MVSEPVYIEHRACDFFKVNDRFINDQLALDQGVTLVQSCQ